MMVWVVGPVTVSGIWWGFEEVDVGGIMLGQGSEIRIGGRRMWERRAIGWPNLSGKSCRRRIAIEASVVAEATAVPGWRSESGQH